MKGIIIKSITFIGKQIERLSVFIDTHQKQLSFIGKILKTAILLLAIVFIPKVMWLSVALYSVLLSEFSLLDLTGLDIYFINIYVLFMVMILCVAVLVFTVPIHKIYDKLVKTISSTWLIVMLVIVFMLGYNTIMTDLKMFKLMDSYHTTNFAKNSGLLIFPSTLVAYGRIAIRIWKKKDTVETITFNNLVKGRTYEYVGTLIDVENGDTLVHSKLFIPNANGKAEIQIVTDDLVNEKSHGKTSM